MALETERRTPEQPSAVAGLVPLLRQGASRLAAAAGMLAALLEPASHWLARQPLVRMLFGSLRRRIIVANLLGFSILFCGILYVGENQPWLIDAKRESLKAQSEIIAAAIAASATVDSDNLVIDPDKLPEIEGSLKPFRDDAFAALELSIKPERVNPILRRLVQPTTNRARIYTRDGTLIADSRTMHLQRTAGGKRVAVPTPSDEPDAALGKVKTRDFWTRLRYWLIDKELPVYKEIGNANGTLYPEVRMALAGSGTTAMLLLNQKGEQIVSVATPIQRARAVQGVLLLSTRPGEIEEIQSEERQVIWTLALMALAASLAASLLLARTVAGPMRLAAQAAAAQLSLAGRVAGRARARLRGGRRGQARCAGNHPRRSESGRGHGHAPGRFCETLTAAVGRQGLLGRRGGGGPCQRRDSHDALQRGAAQTDLRREYAPKPGGRALGAD